MRIAVRPAGLDQQLQANSPSSELRTASESRRTSRIQNQKIAQTKHDNAARQIVGLLAFGLPLRAPGRQGLVGPGAQVCVNIQHMWLDVGIDLPRRHQYVSAFASQHFLQKCFAQLRFVIGGSRLRANRNSISGQHFDTEVSRRKPLDLLNKIRSNAGTGSIDSVTAVTCRVKNSPPQVRRLVYQPILNDVRQRFVR